VRSRTAARPVLTARPEVTVRLITAARPLVPRQQASAGARSHTVVRSALACLRVAARPVVAAKSVGDAGDAAEGGRGPVGACVPAVGDATGGGSAAIDGGKGDAAEGARSPVSARAPAEGDADASAVRRLLAVQLSPRRRASKPSHPPSQPHQRRTHTQRPASLFAS